MDGDEPGCGSASDAREDTAVEPGHGSGQGNPAENPPSRPSRVTRQRVAAGSAGAQKGVFVRRRHIR